MEKTKEILILHEEPTKQVTVMVKNPYEEAMLSKRKELDKISIIEDKKEWFLEYLEIIDKYSYIIAPPESIYDVFTDTELDILFRVVEAEIGEGHTFEQKCNVASVIFNRIKHERFPNTIGEILIESQFATIANRRYENITVSEDTILACEYAYQIGDTTNGCLFFDSNGFLKYEFVFNDEAHNFYKLKEQRHEKKN